MSDDRPRPVAVPPPPAPPAPNEPAGRCLKCQAIIAKAVAYPKLTSNGGPSPLMHVVDGAECGPIAKRLWYHIVGLIGPNHLVSRQPTLETPEENYLQVVEMWRAAMEADIQVRDGKGNIVIGAARPRVVIIDWKPIGAEL